MKFQDFGKNLSGEIENLFSTIGNGRESEEQTHRLDEDFSIEEMIERVKNLDIEDISKPASKENQDRSE